MKETRYYENKPAPRFAFSCTCGESRYIDGFCGIKNCLTCGKDIKDEFIATVNELKSKHQDWENDTEKLHLEFQKDVCSKNEISLETVVSLKAAELLNIMREISEGNLHYEMEYFEMVLKKRITKRD